MIWSKDAKFTWLAMALVATTAIMGGADRNAVLAFSPNLRANNIKVTPATLPSSTELYSSLGAVPSNEGPAIGFDNSCKMTQEESAPIITLKKGTSKEKIINAFGLYSILITAVTNPIWMAAMTVTNTVCNMFPDLDPHRSVYDATGKVWSKVWLSAANSYPSISGDVERLKRDNDLGACLFVANHASWLDIPLLCTVLDPVFKFIAKGELKQIPCIGQQLVGGNHIMIDREDRRSQLRTFKEGVKWLKDGVPLMAFPEGMRSKDGRLMEFKGGIFSMAVKANVPIVPISISNTHAVMPGFCLFPIQNGRGKLHVHVHDAIHIDGKKESELAELVKEKLLSRMPMEQHPLPKIDDMELKEEILASIPVVQGKDSQKDLQKIKSI